MKTKHLLLALLLAAFGTTQVSAYTLYYYDETKYKDWYYVEGEGEMYRERNYKYAVWYWSDWTDNNGDGIQDDGQWTDWMTTVSERENWYQANVPDNCTNIRFIGFKEEVSEPNWDSSSNSSGELYYDGVNAFYRITRYSEWESRGYWQSKFDIINHVQIGELYYNLDLELNTAEVTFSSDRYDYYDNHNYESLSSVVIPAKVEYNDRQLTVTAIGNNAFVRSGLTSVEMPSSITRIGERAFAGTQIATIEIPNGVTTIGTEAFAGCNNLTTVSIPSSVLFIGEHVFGSPYEYFMDYYFNYCESLTNVNVAAGNPNYSSADGVLFNKNKTELIIYPCMKTGASYVVPSTVTHIDAGAFAYSSLNTITLPEHLTQIKERTFYKCYDLAAIDIPADVDSIGNYAFYYCKSLKKATLHSGVKYIGYEAFYNCESLESINLPEGITTIGSEVFYNCRSLTVLELPSTLIYLEDVVFQGCRSLVSIKIPESVLSLGEHRTKEAAEEGYEPKEYEHEYRTTIAGDVNIDHNETVIGYENPMPNLTIVEAPAWFFDVPEVNWTICPKYLENVTVNRGEMNDNVFGVIKRSYKTLKSLDISDASNTSLADEAFKDHYNLTKLVLPANLKRVSYMAVAGCKNLLNIDIPATVEEIDQSAFEDCRSIQTITFGGKQPSTAPGRSVRTAESQLRKIGNWAFYNAHELQHLEIPEGVEEIGDGAFYGCTYLEDLVLPSTVRSIGDNCFALCSKLNMIVVTSPEPPAIAPKTFYDVERQIPVYVPDDCVEAYEDDQLWGEFDIQGVSNMPSALGNISADAARTTKVIRNGQLIIERGGKTYNVQGQEVR